MVVKTATSPILHLIRRAVEDRRLRELPDQELLGRFYAQQDEAAFQALLRRHGPMVLDVCGGVLGNEADAEDAFQATFLILARKAGSIRKMASLGSWLHGVAYRTALKARAQSATRQKHEARGTVRQASEPDDLSWREVRQVLHEEVNGLPERFRAPLVLCYLEGATQEAAAVQLSLGKSALRERLERGRALLRTRLTRRGVGPAALLVAAAWPTVNASASMPVTLMVSTVKAASQFAAGRAAAGLISAKVATLAEGVLNTMLLSKIKTAVVVLVGSALLLGIGAGVSSHLALAENQKQAARELQQRDIDGDGKDTVVVTLPHHITSQEWYLTKVDGNKHTISVSDAGSDKERLHIHQRHEARFFANGMSLDGLAVAKDATVFIDGKEGRFSDLRAGMRVSFQMAKDKSLLAKVNATTLREPKALYVLKSVDAAKNTITVAIGENRPNWGAEWVFSVREQADKGNQLMELPVAKDARIRREWLEIKEGKVDVGGVKSQEIKLTDLKAGWSVALELTAVDGKLLIKGIMVSEAVALTGLFQGPLAQADDPKKERDARQTVEAYLAAVLAGKMEDTAALAIPNQKPESKKRAEGLRELKGKKAIALEKVYASENSGRAIALSEPIQLRTPNSDGEDKGRLVITLNKRGADWLVRDIDLRSEDTDPVPNFQQRYPDAKEVPARANR